VFNRVFLFNVDAIAVFTLIGLYNGISAGDFNLVDVVNLNAVYSVYSVAIAVAVVRRNIYVRCKGLDGLITQRAVSYKIIAAVRYAGSRRVIGLNRISCYMLAGGIDGLSDNR